MKSIPLSKQAFDFGGAIEEAVWDPNAGPMENLLQLAENIGIIFSGGWAAWIAIALEGIGIDLGLLGRFIDRALGLRQLSDLLDHGPSVLAEAGAQVFESGADVMSGGAAQPEDGDGFGSPLGAATEVSLTKLGYGLYGRGYGGRSKIVRVLTWFFGSLFGWLANPTSKLSKAVRAAGIVGAVGIHQGFKNWSGPETRSKMGPAEQSPHQTTRQEQLESTVDQILGAK